MVCGIGSLGVGDRQEARGFLQFRDARQPNLRRHAKCANRSTRARYRVTQPAVAY
jgi:hypothetical protein